jgi:Na+/H+ antiporter NhaD/arsenite permease-like protein
VGLVDAFVLAVFGFVYLGMILGRIPPLALDRTGFALLGALALLVGGRVTLSRAVGVVDIPTMALLFGLMVVSAQFRLSGFYARLAHRLAAAPLSPARLLALLMAVAGLLSALLANDIVCLAMTPVLVAGCAERKLDPKPFVLGLALSANIGSAATLMGNPQNMLIGQTLRLSFARYLLDAGAPAVAGLAAAWWILRRQVAGRWRAETVLVMPSDEPALHRWQTHKGLGILVLCTAAFLFAPVPREIVALAAAAVLLCSRHTKSREMLGLVDWQLLVLFVGLFVVHDAMTSSGMLGQAMAALQQGGVDLSRPGWLFAATAVLSNLVSNVPATMLLLPAATHPLAGPVLALSSTLAGNLIVVGSIANMIVLEQAARMGVRISWREHARVGIPVTLVTLALAAGWLWLVAG